MSEKQIENLIENIADIVAEERIAEGRDEDGRLPDELKDELRDLIGVAVAPLVEALEGMIESCPCQNDCAVDDMTCATRKAQQALKRWKP